MMRLRNRTYVLLRKIEAYTKTDMIYLTKGGFWLTLKKVIVAVVALALSIGFANLLPKTIYGEYKYVFSVFGLLSIPALMGMGKAATRAVAQGYEGTPVQAIKVKMLWGTLGSIASVVVATYYLLNDNHQLAGAFGIVAIFLPFVDTFNLFNSILTGKKLFRVSIAYELFLQVVGVSAVIATLFLTNNLLLVLSSYFVVHTVVRLFILLTVLHRHTNNHSIDPGAIVYGKHLSAMQIAGTIAQSIDGILMWHFVGAAPLAIYAFAKAIPTQISSLLASIPTLALPKFATRDFASIKKTLIERIKKMYVFILIIIAAYIVTAPYIYQIFFPQYTESIIYSQLFVLTLLFFPKKMLATAFSAHARKRPLYLSSTLPALLKIILLIALVPPFGITGAILSEIGTQFFSFTLIGLLFIKAK